VIHLAGPVVLASLLAGLGVYALLARRHVIMVLIGAELLLNAVNVLFVAFGSMPPGGLIASHAQGPAQEAAQNATQGAVDPVLAGQSMAIFVITIAAAEIGLALAIVVQLYRTRSTPNLDEVRELGESSPTYAGELSGKRQVSR
jgi:NADH-quinone oxidoreductase subunit K